MQKSFSVLFSHILATGFGMGLVPVASGTIASLFAMLFAGLIIWFMPTLTLIQTTIFIIITTLMGIWVCGQSAHDMGEHDHRAIVWDEYVGMWLTILLIEGWLQYYLPSQEISATLFFESFMLLAEKKESMRFCLQLMIAFLLFRFFDIFKPWPICWIDKKVFGGLGIMLDDIVAAVLAAAAMITMIFFTIYAFKQIFFY